MQRDATAAPAIAGAQDLRNPTGSRSSGLIRRIGLLFAVVLAVIAGPAAAGPTSPLYVTDSISIYVLQGGAIVDQWDHGIEPGLPGIHTMAVGSTVRTYPQSTQSGTVGSEFALDGSPTGVLYDNTAGCCFRDGTTDGVHNYALRQSVADPIYRFDSDWTNPEALHYRPGGAELGEITGITYDYRTTSLWLVDRSLVYNMSLTGDILGYFLTGFGNAYGSSLAFDPADNTLWVTTYESGQGVLRQYSTAANGPISRPALDTIVLPGMYLVGAEFALQMSVPTGVPEPSTWAMLILGFGMVGALSRRGRARTVRWAATAWRHP